MFHPTHKDKKFIIKITFDSIRLTMHKLFKMKPSILHKTSTRRVETQRSLVVLGDRTSVEQDRRRINRRCHQRMRPFRRWRFTLVVQGCGCIGTNFWLQRMAARHQTCHGIGPRLRRLFAPFQMTHRGYCRYKLVPVSKTKFEMKP